MSVIYDISVLGTGFYIPRARTGIFRVIENLAIELAKSKVISDFSAGGELGSYFRCSAYLQTMDDLKSTSLLKPDVSDGVLRIFEQLQQWSLHGGDGFPYKINKLTNMLAAGSFARDSFAHESLVHAQIYHSPFYPIPQQVKRYKNIKNILTVYDLIPILHPEYFRFNEQKLIRRLLDSIDENTWITAISQATKNDLCNHLPMLDPNRVFVTKLAASAMFYPCFDEKEKIRVRNKFGIPEGEYVLSLSTLEPRKNIAQTIKAFSRLVEEEKMHDLSLVLVGTKGWNFDSIFNAIAANPKVRERIVVTGYASDEDLAPLYSGAMMFVYPSLYEGFGLPPLEAMQCGVPTITSNTSSLPEVVGDAGTMVSPMDEDALCQAMLDIYQSSTLRQKMSSRSLAQAGMFSWERCAEQTVAAYRIALGK